MFNPLVQFSALIITILPLFSPVHAADCSGNSGGVANGECVKFYAGNDSGGGGHTIPRGKALTGPTALATVSYTHLRLFGYKAMVHMG